MREGKSKRVSEQESLCVPDIRHLINTFRKYIYKYRENMEYNQGFRPLLLIDRALGGVYYGYSVSKG